MHFFSLCSLDMRQWAFVFYLQWFIMTLQLVRFLSNAYIPYDFDNRVSQVVMSVADFVTEIPLVSMMTAYYITVAVFFAVCGAAIATMVLHHYCQWILPARLLRYLLFWLALLMTPELIPHFKMVLPCLSYTHDSYTMNPFFTDVVCWHGSHIGYSVLSLFIVSNVVVLTYINSKCFYNSEIPHDVQLANHPVNSKFTGSTETTMILVKTGLLVLNIAGHNANWRIAMGALALLSGLFATYEMVWLLPFWHDTPLTLHIFQCLVLAWTGAVALLMVAFDDAEGAGMLYFVMFPVLLIMARMLLRWRCNVIETLSERELTSPELAIAKLHITRRAYFLWIAQFGDVYIEMNQALEQATERCFELTANIIDIATERFSDSVDLHVLCAQYYTWIEYNRTLAYRSLIFAEKSRGHLDNRFRCLVLRQFLDAEVEKERSLEVKAYTEFSKRRQVRTGRCPRAPQNAFHSS